MKPWQIRTPHAFLWFDHRQGDWDDFVRDVLEILPGVRLERNGSYRVPDNALAVITGFIKQYRVKVFKSAWGIKPSKAPTWEEARAELLAKGEVREKFLGDWPKPYQKDGIANSWRAQGFHLWHATGAGKTFTGIVSATSEEGDIVIVTRAASKLQFAREVARFTKYKAHVLRTDRQRVVKVAVEGRTWWTFYRAKKAQGMSRDEIRDAWVKEKEKGLDKVDGMWEYVEQQHAKGERAIVVVPWEYLRERYSDVIKLRPGAVVFDEAHRGRNPKRWDVVALAELPDDPQAAERLMAQQEAEAKKNGGFIKEDEEGRKMFLPTLTTAAAAANLARSARKVILTTATPVANRVRDLWAQLDLAEPNAWGNATAWLNRHSDRKPGTYGGFDTTGSSHIPELKERLKGRIHIVNKAEAQKFLPDWRRISYYIAPEELTKPTAGFREQMKAAQERGPTALLEVQLAKAASMKRKAVLDLIADHVSSGDKVVVFTARKKDVEDLAKSVREHKLVKSKKATIWGSHGGHSTDVRQEIVDDYMAHPGPCVLVGTGQAFGESINLDKTDAALFVMLPYTPEAILQWEGRFVRNSMDRPVIIYYVIAESTIDERVASILLEKLPNVGDIAQDSSVEGASRALSGYNPDETPEEFAASILAELDYD